MKQIYWTEDQLKAHNRSLRIKKGEPEFESEAEFQVEAEKLLRQCGFMMRKKKEIASNESGLWYEHRPKKMAKKQAIIADLFIWDQSKGATKARMIEIELKNGNTPLSTEQGYLYKRNEIVVCRNMTEFKAVLFEFMKISV